MSTEPLIVISGPTASGKSAAAIVLAERMGAEIVSVDSMQVYRGMDIGTGKPTSAERRRVPHHLIDILHPREGFSARRFVEEAERAIADIRQRGRTPLLVGGTVLYIRALTEGLFEGPGADWDLRNRLIAQAERRGTDYLHRQLARVDPIAASAIHPNDLRRIVRALEVYHKTGRPISQQQRQFDRPGVEERRRLLVLNRQRPDLYRRIDERVDRMMEAGWLEEVRRLIHREGGLGREASQALGYRELADHLAGKITLEQAVELIKRRTRQFARRQMSWFRRLPDVLWVPVAPGERPETTASKLEQLLHHPRLSETQPRPCGSNHQGGTMEGRR